MYRSYLRSVPSSLARAVPRHHATRRFISTAPPHEKSRSWKSSAVRWGLAGAVLYYYNTSKVFADEPTYAARVPLETSRQAEAFPTIESVSEQRVAQAKLQESSPPSPTTASTAVAAPGPEGAVTAPPDDLEQEASQQGAFNEETGEINWDCPCLGGMAHGPCGEQFKAAFSCFVFSQEEPKGVDCIEHFKTMQNCFRDHPDVYGSELEDDEAPPPETLDGQPAPAPATVPEPALAANVEPGHRGEKVSDHTNAIPAPEQVQTSKRERAKAATEQVKQNYEPQSESDEAVPKAWHESR